jgi:hypothetical protein
MMSIRCFGSPSQISRATAYLARVSVELPSTNSRISEPAIRLFPNQTDRRLFGFLAVASGPIPLMGSSCDRRGSFGNCSYSLLGPRCGRRARPILHRYDGWRADLHQHSVALNRRAYWRPRLDSALERVRWGFALAGLLGLGYVQRPRARVIMG